MILRQLKYELQTYFKGTTFVMPIIAIVVFLYALYSVKPIDVMSGYLLTFVFVFFIMVWIGMMEAQRENPVMEQILYLKMGDAKKYYFGKYLFLIVITVIVSFICSVFPCWQNQYLGGDLFLRALSFEDLMNALIIMIGCGMAGATLGNLFHGRVSKNRKLAIVRTVLLSILTICQVSITEEIPALKAILWMLPPVMLPQQIYGNEEFFVLSQSCRTLGILLFYSFIYFVVKSILCHRNKF